MYVSISLAPSCAELVVRRTLTDNIWTSQMLVAEAALRRSHESPRHVPVAGVYQQGGRTFLVEAPYQYTGLEDYLAASTTADRMSLVRI